MAQRALVTGASSGIGAGAVRALRASGREVLAVARREAPLRALARETGCRTLMADVRQAAAIAEAIEAFAPEVIVNNAGVGHGIDGLEGLSADAIREAIEINLLAPAQIVAAALPGMRRRGKGHLVFLGSIAGLHTMVSALYGATKGAVHLFSQNLRWELRGSGLRVTEICPGRVASAFYQAAEGDRARLDAMGRSGLQELTPADIAAAMLFAIDAPPHVNVSTIELLPTGQTVGGPAHAAQIPKPAPEPGRV